MLERGKEDKMLAGGVAKKNCGGGGGGGGMLERGNDYKMGGVRIKIEGGMLERGKEEKMWEVRKQNWGGMHFVIFTPLRHTPTDTGF